ncbi:MAG: hypothetical protein HUJ71_02065 [Pseudobutyrivibrio sp.]|nr:hypothetical protein [Pseudobutyrivibrio sp.]
MSQQKNQKVIPMNLWPQKFAGAYIGIGITLIFTLGAQISGSEYTAGLTN